MKQKIKQNKLISAGIILTLMLFLAIVLQGCSVQSGSQRFRHPDGAELEAILQNFEQYAEKAMEDWQVPGMAIAIIRGDEVIYSKGLGVKKLGESDPVTQNTIFQIGSTSKAFTSTLVAMLVDEGLVDWEDLVIDHLPDFAMYDPEVTQDFRIKDLMSQRSGMPGYSGDELSYFGYSREHIIHCIRHIKPVSEFRSEFAYQNNLFLVAAKLIETKTGKTWEDNIQERIFDPLGMNNSSTDSASFKSAPDVTNLHKMENDEVVPYAVDDNSPFNWLDTYRPAGGINSNLIDMVKWIKFNYHKGRLNNEQLVSRRNMDYLHMAHTFITDTPVNSILSFSYCQAWMLAEYKPFNFNWHNGETSACRTFVAFVPQADIGIVVLSNRVSTLPDNLTYYFFDRYFNKPVFDWSAKALEAHKKLIEEEKESRPVPPENPEPSLSLASYVGEYANIIVDKMSVDIVDGKLVMTIGPSEAQYILNHFNANVFIDGEYNYVTFAADAENNVISAELDLTKVMDDNVLIKQ
jgi:CubicO group peptidase (beta-lactamase class C family)